MQSFAYYCACRCSGLAARRCCFYLGGSGGGAWTAWPALMALRWVPGCQWRRAGHRAEPPLHSSATWLKQSSRHVARVFERSSCVFSSSGVCFMHVFSSISSHECVCRAVQTFHSLCIPHLTMQATYPSSQAPQDALQPPLQAPVAQLQRFQSLLLRLLSYVPIATIFSQDTPMAIDVRHVY